MVAFEQIIDNNLIHDSITSAAALAYVRITKTSPNDAEPVIALMKMGNLSVLNGAAQALTFDDMVPEPNQIHQIIAVINSRLNDINCQHQKGYFDPREYLLSALSNWNREDPVISHFIDQCGQIEFFKTRNNLLNKVKAGKKVYKES